MRDFNDRSTLPLRSMDVKTISIKSRKDERTADTRERKERSCRLSGPEYPMGLCLSFPIQATRETSRLKVFSSSGEDVSDGG